MKALTKYLSWFLLGTALLMGSACGPIYTAHGAYYHVRSGDTLEGIAKQHHVSAQDLAEVNNILESSDLKPGKTIYIPGATPASFAAVMKEHGVAVRNEKPSKSKNEKVAEKKKPAKGTKESKQPEVASSDEESGTAEPEEGGSVKTDHARFSWPIQGDISSLYGMRHGRRHDGIDIRSPSGTPITAAADGEVVFAKSMRGYGNLILVKHRDDFFTVYAHNSVNLAKVGAKVKKGQVIAKVGRTGRATGPHLHFEVREGAKARNPLFFLPRNEYAQKAHERETTAAAEGDSDGDVEAENP